LRELGEIIARVLGIAIGVLHEFLEEFMKTGVRAITWA